MHYALKQLTTFFHNIRNFLKFYSFSLIFNRTLLKKNALRIPDGRINIEIIFNSDSGKFLGLGTVTGSVAIYIAFSLQVTQA